MRDGLTNKCSNRPFGFNNNSNQQSAIICKPQTYLNHLQSPGNKGSKGFRSTKHSAFPRPYEYARAVKNVLRMCSYLCISTLAIVFDLCSLCYTFCAIISFCYTVLSICVGCSESKLVSAIEGCVNNMWDISSHSYYYWNCKFIYIHMTSLTRALLPVLLHVSFLCSWLNYRLQILNIIQAFKMVGQEASAKYNILCRD